MAGEGADAGKLKVFISYSRDDLDFADQLEASLAFWGFDTVIDRHGISGGEDWRQRLGNLIHGADTVVFVLSPSSARSDICAWEVEEAARYGKRILPVLCRSLDGVEPPPHLTTLNYVFFYAEPKSPGSGFGSGLVSLITALNTNFEWLRLHTRYLQRATDWIDGKKSESRLLSGSDIDDAKAWLASRPRDAPQATDLQLEFIRASEFAAEARANAERRRLEEIAAAQEERARALAAEALAQKERDIAARRVVQRTLIGLAVSLALLALTGALGIFAFVKQQEAVQRSIELAHKSKESEGHRQEADRQRSEAENRRRDAESERQIAQQQRDRLLITQTQMMTNIAMERSRVGETGAATAILAEALSLQTAPGRPPHVLAAEAAFYQIGSATREGLQFGGLGDRAGVAERLDRIYVMSRDHDVHVFALATGARVTTLRGHTSTVSGVWFGPDARTVITGAADGMARVWDGISGMELARLPGHDGGVAYVELSKDGTRAITTAKSGAIRVWDWQTGIVRATITAHGKDVWAPSLSDDGSRVVSRDGGKHAHLWNAATGAHMAELTKQSNIIPAFYADGRMLVVMPAYSLEGNVEGMSIWNAVDGSLTSSFTGLYPLFDRARTRMVAIEARSTVAVTDLRDGRRIATLKDVDVGIGQKLSDDGRLYAAFSKPRTVTVWRTDTGDVVSRMTASSGELTNVAFSLDGRRLIGLCGKTATIWNIADGKPLAELSGEGDSEFYDAEATPDGRQFITRSLSTTDAARLHFIDARTLVDLGTASAEASNMNFTKDGRFALASSWRSRKATLWNVAERRLVAELDGIDGQVSSASFFADDSKIGVLFTDGLFRTWSVEPRNRLAVARGEPAPELAGATFAPDGRTALVQVVPRSVRDAGNAYLLDLASGKIGKTLSTHAGSTTGVSFSTSGDRLLTAASDNTMRVWDVRSGVEILSFDGASAIDLDTLLPGDLSRVVVRENKSISRAARFALWSIDTSTTLAQVGGEENEPFSSTSYFLGETERVLYSRSGRRIALSRSLPPPSDKEGAKPTGVLSVVDGSSGRVIAERKEEGFFFEPFAISPDGRRIIVGRREAKADSASLDPAPQVTELWDGDTAERIADMPRSDFALVFDFLFSPDGRTYARQVDGHVELWDASTGKLIADLGEAPVAGSHSTLSGHFAFAYAAGGAELAIGDSTGVLRILEAATGRQLRAIKVHDQPIAVVSITADGRRVALLARDAGVRVVDYATGERIAEFGSPEDDVVDLSPDGRYAVTTGSLDRMVRIWDVGHAKEIGSFEASDLDTTARPWSFSPDGNTLAIVRQLSRGPEPVNWLLDVAAGTLRAPVREPRKAPKSAAFSRDGTRLALVDDEDKAWLLDAATGVAVAELRPAKRRSRMTSVAFDPTGSMIVSTGDQVQLWSAQSGAPIDRLDMKSNTFERFDRAWFSPDGRRVVAGKRREIAIWDVESGRTLLDLTDQRSVVELSKPEAPANVYRAVIVSSDATRVLAVKQPRLRAADDRKPDTPDLDISDAPTKSQTALLIDATSGGIIESFPVNLRAMGSRSLYGRERWSVAFSPDGRLLAMTDTEGNLHLRDAATGRVLPVEARDDSKADEHVLVFAPKAPLIYLGHEDGHVEIWSHATGKRLKTFATGVERLSRLVASDDGRWLLAAGIDKAVILSVEAASPLLTVPLTGGWAEEIAFEAGGGVASILFRRADSSGRDSRLLYRLFPQPSDLVAAAGSVITRCLAPKERESSHLDSEAPAWCRTMQLWPYQTPARNGG